MTSAVTSEQPVKLSKKDFDPGIDVRWCPGCGDYAVLANVQRVLPTFGKPKENFVFISGIGCSSRFPYYLNTYGFHTIHGRAPAVATGLKAARPELEVWVVTGDGDGLSIGGNHLLHAMRRNVDIKILLFNNRVYGLTKGQYSPTSSVGSKTKSTPLGSIDQPFNPLSLAVSADASFIARVADTDAKGLQAILTAAHEHNGTAFVEILQNCPVFNDGTFADITDRKVKADRQLWLEHGKPMRFGSDKKQGIVRRDGRLEAVSLDSPDVREDDVVLHDAQSTDPTLAFELSQFAWPERPVPTGIIRAVDRPAYDTALNAQIEHAREQQGRGSLHSLLHAADVWTVPEVG